MWEFLKDHAPIIATTFFFLFFCHVVYSVFKKSRQKDFDHYSKIPLNDGDDTKNIDKDPAKKNNKTSKKTQIKKPN